jgi:Mg-chelatase subunit ChlD
VAKLGAFLFILSLAIPVSAQPAAPSDIAVAGRRLNRLFVFWKDNSSDETEFRIERSDSGGAFAQIGTAAANTSSYDDTTITLPGDYRYRVKAFRSGDSSTSVPSAIAAAPNPLTGTNFRVFFNTADCPTLSSGAVNCVPATTDGMGQNEVANRMRGILEGARSDYTSLSFNAPYNPESGNPLPINLKWCDGGGCANGGGVGLAPQFLGTYNPATNTGAAVSFAVAVHELFHMVQFSYGGIQTDPDGNWVIEAQARAIQDLVTLDANGITGQNVDDDPTGPANFYAEAMGYLGNPNHPITHISYNAALFWAYLCQRFGTDATEPGLGFDFMRHFWDAAAADPNTDGIQAINNTLSALGRPERFVDAFKDFVIANYVKNLTGPGVLAKYKYVDESQTPGSYGPVALEVSTALAPMEQVGPVLSNVTQWGAVYHEIRPTVAVPYIQVDYKVDSPSPAFFVLLAKKGGDLVHEERQVGLTFARTLANDAYDAVTVIVAGLDQNVNFRYTINGTQPVIHILDPKQGRDAQVGDRLSPEKFLAKVEVLSPAALPITGIPASAFSFKVGTRSVPPSSIVTSAYIQGQYWFVIQAPTQTANAYYNLSAKWTTLSATETNAIQYVATADADNVLVIDRSGSMGPPLAPASKINGAKSAANLYVDSWRNGDKIGVVSFECTALPINLTLRDWDTTSRDDAHAAINLITQGGGTAIGEGLAKGLDELTTSGNTDHAWALILLSDGQNTCGATIQNFLDTWHTRSDAGQKVPKVFTVAIGADANRPDLQRLASETGGTYLFASEPTSKGPFGVDFPLDLAGIFRTVGSRVARQGELLSVRGVNSEREVDDHTFTVDAGASELVVAVRWEFGTLQSVLQDPLGGTGYLPFVEIPGRHQVYRVGSPIPGTWHILLKQSDGCQEFCDSYYLVEASLKSVLEMDLYFGLPLEERIIATPMPILVSLTDIGPVVGGNVHASVTSRTGVETMLTLRDDGAHGDGGSDDGIYGTTFYGTSEGGTYLVVATADGTSPFFGPFMRQVSGAFDMLGDRDMLGDLDIDKDGLPDSYEIRVGLDPNRDDAQEDPDKDGLVNSDECLYGTNPFDPDTDDGGENDGSEVRHGRDPHNPGDDRTRPPRICAYPLVNKVFICFTIPIIGPDIPSPPSFDIYRCLGPNGTWDFLDNVPAMEPFSFFDQQARNGQLYKYRLVSRGSDLQDPEESGPSEEVPATPKDDPYPPHGGILINGGAPTTSMLDATLTLIASDDLDPDYALESKIPVDASATQSGLSEMLISNLSDGSDGMWEPFGAMKPWLLQPNVLGIAPVFVRYRDAAGNESITYNSSIMIVAGPEPTATPTDTPIEGTPTPTNTLQGGATETPTPTCQVPDKDFDLDNSGKVDAGDMIKLLSVIPSHTPPPDFNCDGVLDWNDLYEMARRWHIETP